MTTTATRTNPTWTSQKLIHYPLVEHVELEPSQNNTRPQRLLYTVRWPHFGENGSEFRHTTYLATTQRNAPSRPLTHGATAAQPRWNADGSWIAFLRPTADTGKMGVWVMPADGGEPRPITGVANGIRHAVTTFQWSPDGKSIALITVPWDDDKEQRLRAKNDTRQWRVDYNFAHLYIVEIAETIFAEPDVASTDHTQDNSDQPAHQLSPAHTKLPLCYPLTSGRFHVFAFDWRPDSAEIAFLHRSTPYIDSWTDARLATLSTRSHTSETPTIVDRGLVASWESDLAYSPDGQWIACEVGHDDHQWPYACRVHLFPTAQNIANAANAAPRILHDVMDDQPTVLGWSADSQQVYVQAEKGLSSAILALPIDGSAPLPLYEPEGLITAIHVREDGQAALVLENFTQPQAVYTANLNDHDHLTSLQPLAQPTARNYPQGPLPQVRVRQWQTPDGFTIEGVVYLPHGYDQQRDGALPLLLHIHGGPMSVFQRQFAGTPYYYTPAALCERGIAVLRCNPRGSGGYGRDFRYANLNDWGGGDLADLLQGVDLLVNEGLADASRLGICGWSYGGFMSSWAITQTDRFVAASIGAPVTNVISFIGTSDIPSFIPGFFGGEVWDRQELMIERSPLFQAHKAVTPSLIQHGDADERVPLEQGLQFHMALERRGVPVEMYIYPRQGHAINEPHLLADAIQRNLDWFTAKLLAPIA